MAGAHRVAAAGIVDVVPPIRRQQVIAAVVHPAVAVDRPGLAAFGRVVVDHIEPHLDFRRVERLHHRSELVERVAVRVRLMGREEVQGHVAPVVALLRIELVDRQQLHNRDAELREVRNLLRQAGKCAAPVRRDARVRARRESLDVQLVDDAISAGVPRARLDRGGDGSPVRQAAERRPPVGRAWLRTGIPAERGGKNTDGAYGSSRTF